MSPEEKQNKSLLLKQWWSLMQLDIDKVVIKINHHFFKGMKYSYSYVSNSVFNLVNDSPPVSSQSSSN